MAVKTGSIAFRKTHRWLIPMAGFHVVGTIFEKAFIDGNPDNELHGLQTMSIAPGEGAMIEFTVLQPSRYPSLTHSFGDADLGAMGAFIAK